ncbi:MAG: BrnT family toxin [Chloroflexota bacterium]
MNLTFERDDAKTRRNLAKHGVAFEEAATVFGDPLSLTVPDPGHSSPDEQRFATAGTKRSVIWPRLRSRNAPLESFPCVMLAWRKMRAQETRADVASMGIWNPDLAPKTSHEGVAAPVAWFVETELPEAANEIVPLDWAKRGHPSGDLPNGGVHPIDDREFVMVVNAQQQPASKNAA